MQPCPVDPYSATCNDHTYILHTTRGRLQGELAMVLPVCRISVSICCAKRRETSFFTHALEGDKPVHHFPRFRPHIFLEQSVVVDVEGVGFRPRVVVAERGVVAVCTRISSQEYVYDK